MYIWLAPILPITGYDWVFHTRKVFQARNKNSKKPANANDHALISTIIYATGLNSHR